ncbi:MAG: hypothetical protein DSY43_05600 [Gammaproteobacteria bacterium]|nr:MAG: hypothetical protein DSY43_05600 [Gammaproteobacteria bacterium]
MKQKKKQETEYLYWSKGILLGILGSILGSFLVSSFFVIYEKFDCSLQSLPKLQTVVFIISALLLVFMYFNFKTKINKLTGEHLRDFHQEKLNKELIGGRLKSALSVSVLRKDPSLNLNISKAIDIILRKKENPLTFLEEYKKIKEIDLSIYSIEAYKDFFNHIKEFENSEAIGSVAIVERFFKNDYTKPIDIDFWRNFGDKMVSLMDFFGSANGYGTTSLLLYCLLSNITKQPITEFSCGGDYTAQIEGLNLLIQLLKENPHIKADIKETLEKVKHLNKIS